MKPIRTKSLCIVALLVLIVARGTAKAEETKLTVLSFNILVEIANDPTVPIWKKRRDAMVSLIKEAKPDLIGLQEPTRGQFDFLSANLPDMTGLVAEKFTDAAILYKTSLFEEISRGHWWLSPTPERLSTGFGNFLPRIVIWIKLKHKPTGQELFFFNTHFDNTRPCQEKMADLCAQKFVPFLEQKLPIIFVGDFNTDQQRGKYSLLTSNGWRDSYLASPKASPTGRDDLVSTALDGQMRIDHIFYHGEKLKAVRWDRLDYDPKFPLSDHYPVRAELILKTK